MLVDLRRVDRQLADIDARIAQAITASGTTLTQIVGVGAVLAAVIIGHAGDMGRFPSRRLNAAIHMVALSQLSHDSPGRAYLQRRIDEGKTRREAMRALERQLTNVIYQHLLEDARQGILNAAAA